jgi:hypothetical protein
MYPQTLTFWQLAAVLFSERLHQLIPSVAVLFFGEVLVLFGQQERAQMYRRIRILSQFADVLFFAQASVSAFQKQQGQESQLSQVL